MDENAESEGKTIVLTTGTPREDHFQVRTTAFSFCTIPPERFTEGKSSTFSSAPESYLRFWQNPAHKPWFVHLEICRHEFCQSMPYVFVCLFLQIFKLIFPGVSFLLTPLGPVQTSPETLSYGSSPEAYNLEGCSKQVTYKPT